MKVNFSELLDGGRLRSLWGRSCDPSNAVDTLNQILSRLPSPAHAGPAGADSAAGLNSAAASAAAAPAAPRQEPVDLAEVPVEPPHQILAALETALRLELGSRSAMVRSQIEALRVRVHKLDPTAAPPPYHPLRHAASGSIVQLLGRLEDTLHGLRRVAGK